MVFHIRLSQLYYQFRLSIMKINTDEKIKELIDKVKGYIADEDGWKLAKKSVSSKLVMLLLVETVDCCDRS